MALDAKKHTTIAAGEAPTRAAIAAGLFSIDDIIPVANATEANQVAAAVASAGQTLATNPVFVSRADARGLHRIEYTYDGTVWLPFSGVLEFASTGDRDTWTTTNSSLLTSADRCVIAGTPYSWDGASWRQVIEAGNYIARAAAGGVASNGSLATITGMSVVVDNGTFTHSAGVFTCQKTGRYNIELVVNWSANATGTRGGRIICGGVTRTERVAADSVVDSTSNPKILGITMNATDTFSVLQQQSSGGSLSMSPEVRVERVA